MAKKMAMKHKNRIAETVLGDPYKFVQALYAMNLDLLEEITLLAPKKTKK